MARRSFDIGPRRSGVKREQREKPRRQKKRVSTHPRLPSQTPQKRKLRTRRRDAAMRSMSLTVCALLLGAGAFIAALWQPGVRIAHVDASEIPDPGGAAALARHALSGTYYGIIPRDSFFLYPEHAVQHAVLDAYPELVSLSLRRDGFTSLHLTGHPREAAFWWCGTPDALSAEDRTCYDADADGLVFAPAQGDASSTMVRIYASLDTSTVSSYPLKGRVEGLGYLPDVLSFVRMLDSLHVPVASLAIRDDEADLFVAPGTRITYVIGHEAAAAESARAAFPALTLTNGSITYVDLRFDGKVYIKRAGE